MPASDSAAAILLDLLGVTRTTNIDGIFSGTTSQLNTFIVAMEALNNGAQVGVTFVSSLSTFANKTVYVDSFGWNYVKGSPNKITYSLQLTEGV